jgi:hypothetical protein
MDAKLRWKVQLKALGPVFGEHGEVLLKCCLGQHLGLSGQIAFVTHQVSCNLTMPSGYGANIKKCISRKGG